MADNVKVLPVGAKLNSGAAEYTVVRVLGAGGFGVTYLVTTNIKHGNVSFQVNMALKEHFRSALCDRDLDSNQVVVSNPVREEVENSLKDFLSEARRLQHVGSQHRNIVKVNEVFQGNNTAYYVMEYLEGQSLRNYVMQFGALSQEQMTEVMRPIVDAVSYLHSQHMTHLDIKPDNIIVTRDEDGSLRPVLIDFGLAKHYTDDGHPTSTINTLGCSDGYAPAEQYAGITTFSPKADVYALGATILFCLTGKNPRKSTELSRAELEDTLNKLNITPELRTALLGATAYIPMDRTDSAVAILPKDTLVTAKVADASGNTPETTPFIAPAPARVETTNLSDKVNQDKREIEEYYSEEPKKNWLKYGIIASVALVIIGGLIFFLMSGYNQNEYSEEVAALPDSVEMGTPYEEVVADPDKLAELANSSETNEEPKQQSVQQEQTSADKVESQVQPRSREEETPPLRQETQSEQTPAPQQNTNQSSSSNNSNNNNSPSRNNSNNDSQTFNRGLLAYNQRNYTRAKEIFESISTNNRAQYYLGLMYEDGLGMRRDYAQAIRWYTMSADQGNANAQCNLAYLYERGMGTSQNYSEAARLYRLSANQGNANAQCNLGCLYKEGNGVARDYSEAFRWFRLSANQGNALGQANLAFMYENGYGVQRDVQEAIRLYRLAVLQGDHWAEDRLRRLGVED